MKGTKLPPSMAVASIWIIWGFLGTGVVGWALFVVLEAFDSKRDAAAWVQAVGSVLAIIAAIAVANESNRRAAQVARRAESQLLDKLTSVAAYVAAISQNAYTELRHGSSDRRTVERFEVSLRDCDYLLKEIPFSQIPGAEAAIAWLELRGAVQDVLQDVRTVKSTAQGQLELRVFIDMKLAASRATNAYYRFTKAVAR